MREKLEDAIFAQPAPVFSVGGELRCPQGDALTQELVRLYNFLFAEENKKVLQADRKYERHLNNEFWREYKNERRRYGLPVRERSPYEEVAK